ncbi:MAG: ABC transporter permease [Chloroflexi bacterium]|nr:ABC transporter permease [Chloroflexota bacterium]
MSILTDTWYQTLRDLKARIRMPVWIFLSLFQPILWLLLFPEIFDSLSLMPGIGGSYLQFMAPGVIVMTVLFGSAWAGFGMLSDIEMGILSKMMATPVTRSSIIMGRVVSAMVVLLIQALIIFIIAIARGVDLATGAPGVLLSIALISLLGLGFAAFSNGLALLFKRQEPLIGIINLIALPMTFLSSTMMPGELLPNWLDTVRRFNPIDYGVVGVRDLLSEGYIWSDLWLCFVVLAAWAVAGVAFGTLMFRTRAE